MQRINKANAQDVANFVYSLHLLGWGCVEHYEVAAQKFVTLPQSTVQEYSNIIWALGYRLNHVSPVIGQLLRGFFSIEDKQKP